MALLLFTAGQNVRSVSEGVYTAAQAERGRGHYQRTCEPCHGPSLGGGVGSALTGDAFLQNWSSLPLDHLIERVRTMPPDSPTRLSESVSDDLVAYILSANGFPAGERPLDAADAGQIRIEPPAGGEAVPNFSLVHIVGCLARGDGGGWQLNRAGAPARTRNPEPSQGEELARAAASPPGTATYELRDVYPSPDKLAGSLVEAKGFLIRGPVDRVNVTALAALAASCPR